MGPSPSAPRRPILHGERQAGRHQDHPVGALGDPHVQPALGVTEGAAKVRHLRALQRLRGLLGQDIEEGSQ